MVILQSKFMAILLVIIATVGCVLKQSSDLYQMTDYDEVLKRNATIITTAIVENAAPFEKGTSATNVSTKAVENIPMKSAATDNSKNNSAVSTHDVANLPRMPAANAVRQSQKSAVTGANMTTNKNIGAVDPTTNVFSEQSPQKQQSNPSVAEMRARLVEDPSTYMPSPRQSYSWHNMTKQQRPLQFLHIPKTGGTSIEEAAKRRGLHWGRHMFRGGNLCPCINVKNGTQQLMAKDLKLVKRTTNYRGPVFWHSPIQYLPTKDTIANNYINANYINPYENQDIFAVIRNPYKRLVSEYYYSCKFSECFGEDGKRDTAKRLNEQIQKWLKNVQGITQPVTKTTVAFKYFLRDGHLVPQYDYVFGPSSKSQRLVEHVLHFEHMAGEFQSLAEAYGLEGMELGHALDRNDITKKGPQCTAANLTATTRKLIEDIYQGDFELGGYTMIERSLKE